MARSTILHTGSGVNLLVFRLGKGRFGVPMRQVERVVRAVEIARLPDAPPVVEGLIDVHGTLRPVFDMRLGLGLPSRPVALDDHFVLASAASRAVALHVDEVEDVRPADVAALEAATGIEDARGRVAGVARLDDGLVVIHDLDAFLTQSQAAQLERALAAHDPAAEQDA